MQFPLIQILWVDALASCLGCRDPAQANSATGHTALGQWRKKKKARRQTYPLRVQRAQSGHQEHILQKNPNQTTGRLDDYGGVCCQWWLPSIWKRTEAWPLQAASYLPNDSVLPNQWSNGTWVRRTNYGVRISILVVTEMQGEGVQAGRAGHSSMIVCTEYLHRRLRSRPANCVAGGLCA